jgi:pimeloyl-ACP methyl ester carboxylesterase
LDINFIHHINGKLAYTKKGFGENILICFHGFGQSKAIFDEYLPELPDFTIFCFDLYFHGDSIWHNIDVELSKKLFLDIFKLFLEKEKVKDFSILSYSLGSKSAIAIALEYEVKKLILISPDGIKTNFWYNLATYQKFLSSHFKKIVDNPQFYYKILQFFDKIKLLDRGIIKFARQEMDTYPKRLLVYNTWMVYRQLSFSKSEIYTLIKKYNQNLFIVLGKYDRIINEKDIRKKLKNTGFENYIIITSGHTKLPIKFKESGLIQKILIT